MWLFVHVQFCSYSAGTFFYWFLYLISLQVSQGMVGQVVARRAAGVILEMIKVQYVIHLSFQLNSLYENATMQPGKTDIL